MGAIERAVWSVNGTVRMFLQDDGVFGERTHKGKNDSGIFSHTSGTHALFTPVPMICKVLIKQKQVDRRVACTFFLCVT